MNEPNSSRPMRGRGMIAALFGMFVLGLLAMGWLLSRTEMGQSMIRADVPATLPLVQPQPEAGPQAATPAPVPELPAPAPVLTTEIPGRLAAIEGRVASLEAMPGNSSVVSAARAESLFAILAAARRFDRGQSFGSLDAELATRFKGAEPAAIAALADWSKQPVTLTTLRTEFDGLQKEESINGDSWWDRVTTGLGSLISVRDAAAPAASPAHVLVQARAHMDHGDVSAAIAALKAAGTEPVKAWTAKALRYVKARQALERLEDVALVVETRSPPIPAPPPVPRTVIAPEPAIGTEI